MMIRIPPDRLPPTLRTDARFAAVVMPATALATPLQVGSYLRAHAEQLVIDGDMTETELAALDAANAFYPARVWQPTEKSR